MSLVDPSLAPKFFFFFFGGGGGWVGSIWALGITKLVLGVAIWAWGEGGYHMCFSGYYMVCSEVTIRPAVTMTRVFLCKTRGSGRVEGQAKGLGCLNPKP